MRDKFSEISFCELFEINGGGGDGKGKSGGKGAAEGRVAARKFAEDVNKAAQSAPSGQVKQAVSKVTPVTSTERSSSPKRKAG